eukprot:TRINITY_DN59471_c0_g1_i1.p1 TRINITY_DN59471_c0_g1~~TRINITY_DN59471_c0_g1_i1.p1  ORF type:complete len:141 (+),score=26.04 TRINITY_DN59471_c0_g1_i1:2-424(+)
MDAFPGCDARVVSNAKLAECRQLCLEEGYGGFVLKNGSALFRTASGPVLRQHLETTSENSTFYVLTAREVNSQDMQRLQPQLSQGPEAKLPLSREERLSALKLFSPKAVRKLLRKRTSSCGSTILSGQREDSDEEVVVVD